MLTLLMCGVFLTRGKQMKEKRIIIVAGGTLSAWALTQIERDDVLVGADRGALFLIEHGYRPDIAIGDFDSVTEEERMKIRTGSKQYYTVDAVMKDWTDMEMAVEWALEQRPASMAIIGGIGTRLDHTLANVHLLKKAVEHGIACTLLDEHNEVQLIDRHARVAKRHYTYCSLIPLSMEVTGITLDGFQYPLHDATLKVGETLGLSNVIVEQHGDVSIKSGLLLVILSRD